MSITLAGQTRAYLKTKAEYDRKYQAAKKAKQRLDEAERKLRERFDSEEVTSLRTGGKLVNRPSPTPYAQIQDRAAFVAWAEANDDSLIKTEERKGELHELVRHRLDDGEELPPGVGFYVKETMSVTAA